MRVYYLTDNLGDACLNNCPFAKKDAGWKVGSFACQTKCPHCLGHSTKYTRYAVFQNGEKIELRPNDWIFCTAPYTNKPSKIHRWYLKYIYIPVLAFIETYL